MMTALILVLLISLMGWSGWRARPYGKLGLYSWLQSVLLLLPWGVFFTLGSAGIYLNFAGMLILFVLSTAIYIVLGRQIRSIAPEELAKRAEAIIQARATVNREDQGSANGEQPNATNPSQSTPNLDLNPGINASLGELAPMPSEDIAAIRGIFGLDTFFVTEAVPFQDGVVFNGNLRGEIATTFDKLSTALQEIMGDRYRLFLIENQDSRPTVVVLPSSNDPQPLTLSQTILAGLLALGTIATSFETAGILKGFDFYLSPERYREVLPIGLGLVSVLLVHELGHWIMAKRYNAKLSLPFFFPTWEIGSFGALTSFQSILKTRTELFDISFAGPASGGLYALGLLLTGLFLSNEGSEFKVPTEFFEGSILVGTLARVILGSAVKEAIVPVHPFVVLGWLGLIVTAINLMPAGRLDGGRMVQAIYGRKIASRTSLATLILLGIVALVNQFALYWAIVILFLQRSLERPSLNELVEPNDTRAALALLSLFLMITILLPLTPSLAGRLGFPV